MKQERPLIVNGMLFRDWCRAIDRIIASNHGIGSHKTKLWPAEQFWIEGHTPLEGYALWRLGWPQTEKERKAV